MGKLRFGYVPITERTRGAVMAVGIRIKLAGVDAEQFELEAAINPRGADHPDGLIFHASGPIDGGWGAWTSGSRARSSTPLRRGALAPGFKPPGFKPSRRFMNSLFTSTCRGRAADRKPEQPSACEHERSDRRRALASRPGGLAQTLPHCAVPQPATAARVRGVGTSGRVRRDRTRRRSCGVQGRSRRVGVGGGDERGQLVPSSPRSGGAHLDRRRARRRIQRPLSQ